MNPSVRRRHHMPFGAAPTAGGQVRFRLWAPAARRVEVALYHGNGTQLLPMHPLPGGWFALETDAAHAGSLYRFLVDGEHEVADPASRFNPEGVHGASAVVDPLSFAWNDEDWRAPPWPGAVLYELHVGAFTPEGTYGGVAARLEHLARLGITAIELMPLNAFPGTRDWGYDGVLPFAPQASYGTPDELKALIDSAHRSGLAVLLDVVYNHFGPEGNYLHRYAPQFFSARHVTPWGPAINFDGPGSDAVRDFFIHNALYWLEEYHFDGLRLDAIHAVHDTSATHIVTEIARAARGSRLWCATRRRSRPRRRCCCSRRRRRSCSWARSGRPSSPFRGSAISRPSSRRAFTRTAAASIPARPTPPRPRPLPARASTGAYSGRGPMRAPSPFTGRCSRSAAPRLRRGI